VLLPFGMQFAHAFESHEDLDCITTYEEHIHEHEFHCDVFHFKINNDTSVPFSTLEFAHIEILAKEIITVVSDIVSHKIHCKSSRAPPVLLFFKG
jgi:hypothetical protein